VSLDATAQAEAAFRSASDYDLNDLRIDRVGGQPEMMVRCDVFGIERWWTVRMSDLGEDQVEHAARELARRVANVYAKVRG
jgi:hypothetical protein